MGWVAHRCGQGVCVCVCGQCVRRGESLPAQLPSHWYYWYESKQVDFQVSLMLGIWKTKNELLRNTYSKQQASRHKESKIDRCYVSTVQVILVSRSPFAVSLFMLSAFIVYRNTTFGFWKQALESSHIQKGRAAHSSARLRRGTGIYITSVWYHPSYANCT